MKILFHPGVTSLSASFGLLILRGFGVMMATHGWQKYSNSADMIKGWKFNIIGSSAEVNFWLLVFAELGCAIAVAAGFLTRLACLPLIFAMSVAAFHTDAGHGKVTSDGEMSFIYLLAFAALLFTGAGRFSVDSLISGKKAA